MGMSVTAADILVFLLIEINHTSITLPVSCLYIINFMVYFTSCSSFSQSNQKIWSRHGHITLFFGNFTVYAYQTSEIFL